MYIICILLYHIITIDLLCFTPPKEKKTPTPPKTNMEGPKMMVWKRRLLLNMAIFGIYVKFVVGNLSARI